MIEDVGHSVVCLVSSEAARIMYFHKSLCVILYQFVIISRGKTRWWGSGRLQPSCWTEEAERGPAEPLPSRDRGAAPSQRTGEDVETTERNHGLYLLYVFSKYQNSSFTGIKQQMFIRSYTSSNMHQLTQSLSTHSSLARTFFIAALQSCFIVAYLCLFHTHTQSHTLQSLFESTRVIYIVCPFIMCVSVSMCVPR